MFHRGQLLISLHTNTSVCIYGLLLQKGLETPRCVAPATANILGHHNGAVDTLGSQDELSIILEPDNIGFVCREHKLGSSFQTSVT